MLRQLCKVYCPSQEHQPGSKVMCTYIEIDQVPKTNAVILSKPAWMWGAEMGANQHGVCIGNEAVWTKLNSDDDLTERLLGMDIVRLVLERVKTSKEGVELIGELLNNYGQGGSCYESTQLSAYHNSFLLADRTEAWVLETAGRFWAAELIKEGVRNISNQLTIGTKIDMMSPNLIEEAKSSGLYKESDGDFNFSLVFAKDTTPVNRFVNGKRLLEEYSKEGKFGMRDMAKILRDEKNEICRLGGGGLSLSTGSQISVIPTGASLSPPLHWFTATPNPNVSIYKPFIFCPDVDLGDLTVSPKFGADDPLLMQPRFSKTVDRRHALYKGHDNFVKLLNTENPMGLMISQNLKELEDKCVDDMMEILQNFDENSCKKVSQIFKHMCNIELNFYKIG
ncbi:secernin-2-like isoform X5 [Mytilus californianus]|uniref:secernin-2-like isoform X3 n=1 Tax=Mytilus californianus TaxID=6549 RepID=UPI0022455782|nr:secernin-2-like isoform X3 [Mytilus californianus]XP_052096141.1 secernin-2-like isoform X4 [Mytilus californianus]XP_052096142.1 secernin-2-like isoform X5 [Mytilus californianus]